MDRVTYQAVGSVRGACGHKHYTTSAAAECAITDRNACARLGGGAYSDRRFVIGSDDSRYSVDSIDLDPALKTVYCTQGRPVASEVAAEEWGPRVQLGYSSEQPGQCRAGYEVVGYVCAHRSGPRIPVLLPID